MPDNGTDKRMGGKVLTIDQGNSSVKLTVVAGGEAVASFRSEHLSLEALIEVAEDYDICGALYCSVARLDARILESVSRLLQPRPVIVLTHSTPLPVKIDYQTSGTLGLDRIATAAAVASEPELLPALVADAGSAITLDIVDGEGTFRGGNISPGVLMRFRALHHYTGRLPIVGAEGPTPEFGYDTATAIRSGVIRGAAAEIREACRESVRRYGVRTLVITGGGADVLLPFLGNELPVSHQPSLLALGLEKIFHYNIDHRASHGSA